MYNEVGLKRKSIRAWLVFFIVSLVLSGVTAFAVTNGLAWVSPLLGDGAARSWLQDVLVALREAELRYPFLLYGYDWLGFAHIVIAIAFIGPYQHPVRNKWVVQFGLICCALVPAAALIMGGIRGIPMWWRWIDAAFGIVGCLPLLVIRHKIEKLETLMNKEQPADTYDYSLI